MVDKYKSTGRVRKRKTRATTDRLIQRKLKLDQRKSTSTVKVEIVNESRISLHVDTIRKWAHKVGRAVHKKSYVNKISRGKRLKFGKEMLEKSVNIWKNIVWSNECKLNFFGSDGKVVVWRIPGEKFDPKCRIPAVKYGDDLGLFHPSESWQTVCIRWYHGQILLSEQSLQPSINHFKLDQRCIIMILNIPQE